MLIHKSLVVFVEKVMKNSIFICYLLMYHVNKG